jgi:uncharacterized protein HemX
MLTLPTWLAVIAPLLAVATVLVGLGRVLSTLSEVQREQQSARAESKAQHEETRREIASLREDRVRAEVTAAAQAQRIERLESEVERLRDSVHALLRREQGHVS